MAEGLHRIGFDVDDARTWNETIVSSDSKGAHGVLDIADALAPDAFPPVVRVLVQDRSPAPSRENTPDSIGTETNNHPS
ncbi:MAG: hypothetical protein ACLP1W_19005, partial [Rhodomicrobium sp.]